MAKNAKIEVRIELEEKQTIEARAKDRGFDSVSAYMLYLLRNDSKKEGNDRS